MIFYEDSYRFTLNTINKGNELTYLLTWADSNYTSANAVARNIIENIRITLLRDRRLSNRAIKKFLQDINITSEASGVRIVSSNKIFNYLEQGTSPRQMTYLRGKRVPIKTNDGRTIIRYVSQESLERGGWWNPGIEARYYLRDTVVDSVSESVMEARQNLGMVIPWIQRLQKNLTGLFMRTLRQFS